MTDQAGLYKRIGREFGRTGMRKPERLSVGIVNIRYKRGSARLVDLHLDRQIAITLPHNARR